MTRNEQRAARGREAIALHPDTQDFETATTDIIADILHAAEAAGVSRGEMGALLERAQRTYEGDAEDRS